MNRTKTITAIIGAIAMTLGLLLFFESRNLEITTHPVFGGTPGNVATQLNRATSTQIAAKGRVRVFSDYSATTTCSSRVVSAYGGPVTVSFDEARTDAQEVFGNLSSTTLSYMRGHQLASSTLHTFDGSLYGCGDMSIYAAEASTTVTISEFRY